MRHASGTMGPSKSAYSIDDGGPELLPLVMVVTPRRSRTVASYCQFSIRLSCVVAGMPGEHVIVGLGVVPAAPPLPVLLPPVPVPVELPLPVPEPPVLLPPVPV